MKTRLLMIFAIVGFLSLISSLPQNAYACSCNGYPDYMVTLMESKTAFQGTVKDIQTDEGPRKITFDIHQIQKGNYSYGNYTLVDSSIIYYGNDMIKMGGCSVDYKIGETYQVFTYNGGIIGTTDMCSTKQITGFYEYSHEDEDGQMQHYREDYNILTQYNLWSMIIPISIAIIIPSFVVWRKRK